MKAKKTKLAALLLAGAMLLTASGCGGGGSSSSSQSSAEGSSSTASSSSEAEVSEASESEPTEEVTLTFMANVSSTSEDSIKPLVEAYEAEGVTIDYQTVAGSTNDYQQKLTTMFAAGTYPDVLYVPTIWTKMHAEQGVVMSLEGKIDQEVLDDFNEGPLETCMYNGELMGLPMNNDCITIFYNKGQVEAAGIDNLPESYEDAWTWEEFKEAAATAKESSGTMHGMVFGSDFSVLLPFFWQSGATVLSSELDAVTVNQQGTIDTLNYLRSLADEELCSTNIFLGVDDAEAMFVSQQSPFYVGNCGSTRNLLAKIDGTFELGVTYLPQGKEHANKIGGWNIEILKETEHPEEAQAFLEYMVSPEVMNTFCQQGGSMPTRQSAADSIEFGELEEYAPLFIEEIANIPDWVITDSVNEQYQTYKGLMSQEFQNFISNPSQTAETTAENMQKSIEQALGLG